MTPTRKDVTGMLSVYLAAELDEHVIEQGFRRQEHSLRYSRPIGEGTQHLEACFDLNPNYAPGAVAHLLPRLSVTLPELNKTVVDMAGNTPALIASARVTFSQQLQNAAPRSVRAQATRWFIFNDDSARRCVLSMREFMHQWSIPFLNKYASAAALIEGYEQQDECLPHDQRFSLFIAAAYTLLNQPARAMGVLENKFGKPGPRRDYAKAFEYVSRLLADAERSQKPFRGGSEER